MMTDSPRFIVDGMLGSLARWLRMLGYDTLYDRDWNDQTISGLSKEESRLVITRDRGLAQMTSGVLIESVNLDEQLDAVKMRFHLNFQEDRIRCSECNGQLERLSPDDAKTRIPENSFAHSTKHWVCKGCGKTYWDGTHWQRIMERFRQHGLTGEAKQ